MAEEIAVVDMFAGPGGLAVAYVELLKGFQPKAFIFDDVPGILNAGKSKLFRGGKKNG